MTLLFPPFSRKSLWAKAHERLACSLPVGLEQCATGPSHSSEGIVTSLWHALPLLATAAYCIILAALHLAAEWERVLWVKTLPCEISAKLLNNAGPQDQEGKSLASLSISFSVCLVIPLLSKGCAAHLILNLNWLSPASLKKKNIKNFPVFF